MSVGPAWPPRVRVTGVDRNRLEIIHRGLLDCVGCVERRGEARRSPNRPGHRGKNRGGYVGAGLDVEGDGQAAGRRYGKPNRATGFRMRSEEHTSELQSLMRISYAVFCLKKKKKHTAHRLQEAET